MRASNDGHTFHARWAARKALQLVLPNGKDDLFAIAVEGLSTNETAEPGDEASEMVMYCLWSIVYNQLGIVYQRIFWKPYV